MSACYFTELHYPAVFGGLYAGLCVIHLAECTHHYDNG